MTLSEDYWDTYHHSLSEKTHAYVVSASKLLGSGALERCTPMVYSEESPMHSLCMQWLWPDVTWLPSKLLVA